MAHNERSAKEAVEPVEDRPPPEPAIPWLENEMALVGKVQELGRNATELERAERLVAFRHIYSKVQLPMHDQHGSGPVADRARGRPFLHDRSRVGRKLRAPEFPTGKPELLGRA